MQQMTDKKNIEDVTNSPKDWEDFWHSPEKYGTWDTTSDDIVVNMDGGVGGSWEVKVDRNDNSIFDEDLGLSYSVDEETLAELMKPRNPVSNYVDDVLNGKNSICKRESPLSE